MQQPDIGYLTETQNSSQYLKIFVCLSIPYTLNCLTNYARNKHDM